MAGFSSTWHYSSYATNYSSCILVVRMRRCTVKAPITHSYLDYRICEFFTRTFFYHLVRKVRATTLLLHTRYKWFRPLCTASIFRKVHQFWPDCFDAFLGKEKSFHNHVCPCFRYDSGEDGLVPLYLVTQKVPEMKILG